VIAFRLPCPEPTYDFHPLSGIPPRGGILKTSQHRGPDEYSLSKGDYRITNLKKTKLYTIKAIDASLLISIFSNIIMGEWKSFGVGRRMARLRVSWLKSLSAEPK